MQDKTKDVINIRIYTILTASYPATQVICTLTDVTQKSEFLKLEALGLTKIT